MLFYFCRINIDLMLYHRSLPVINYIPSSNQFTYLWLYNMKHNRVSNQNLINISLHINFADACISRMERAVITILTLTGSSIVKC
jgi:hypothetical protein